MRGIGHIILGALLTLCALPAQALDCRNVTYAGSGYSYCTVDMAQDDLRLFLTDDAGQTYSHFTTLNAALSARGQRLAFAMNAGMYHADRSPVGHYVENWVEAMRVIPNAGPGNFGLVPNGILCIRSGHAEVIETLAFIDRAPTCRDATQSGPMLVIDGALHPRFLPDSTSRYIRNGVGTTADGKTAYFVISNNAVTFFEFGSFFRDVLATPNALYFDGSISRLHAPDLGRSDPGFRMGPIVGVVTPTE